MVKIYVDKTNTIEIKFKNVTEAYNYVADAMHLEAKDFYLEQNGKPIHDALDQEIPIYMRLRVLGGKGGFGSMLRAIGAQIEKTTNREACRDLSGRRLRDINEEKRLKAWLEKQGEREREAEERKKRKIEKLLAVPKHEFKDEEYEEARSKLTEKVYNALEEGLKKSSTDRTDLKRKHEASTSLIAAKKKKTTMWIDEDISSTDDTDSDDDLDISKNVMKEEIYLTAKDSEETIPNNEKLFANRNESNFDSTCKSVSINSFK